MIAINIEKAKAICHDVRRVARAEEFAPLDIKATIPSEANAAEAARQLVREKYRVIQEQINAAKNTDELQVELEKMKAQE